MPHHTGFTQTPTQAVNVNHILITVRQLGAGVGRFLLCELLLGSLVYGVHSVLNNLFFLRLGFTATDIGRFNAIGILGFGACALGFGLIRFRSDRRLLMQRGAAAALAASLLLPAISLAPSAVQGHLVVIALVLRGLGLAAYAVNSQPFLATAAAEGRRGDAFAAWGAVSMAAGFVGSLIGGLLPEVLAGSQEALSGPGPYAAALVVATIVVLPAPMLLGRIGDRGAPADLAAVATAPARALPADAARRGITVPLLGALMLLRVIGIAGLLTFFNLYLDQRLLVSPAVIGGVWSLAMLVAIPLVLAVPALIRRSGYGPVYLASLSGVAAGLVLAAVIPTVVGAAIGFVIVNALTYVARVSFLVFAQEAVPLSSRTAMAGVAETAAATGFAIMGFAGGPLIAVFSYRAVFAVGALITGLGAVLAAPVMKRG